MKTGFNEATAMKRSNLALDLQFCEKYNYDYIEIRLDMLQEYLKTHTMDDLKLFFAKSHLKPYALNSIENINFCDEKQWKKMLELFVFACKMAKELQNPYIVVVPTMGDDMKNKTYKEVFDDSVRVLKELSDIAKPYGVKLAFEPIGDPRWCVRSMKQAWEIVKEVDRDDVGVVVDAFNLYMYNKLEDMDDIKEVPLEKIFVFHIDDSEDIPLDTLDHCHRMFPGDGVIKLKELIQLLKDKGYTEIASVEIFRPEYWEMDVEEVIRLGYEKTKKVITM
jgi:2-keto-myo-inositol isomerase